MQIEKIKVIVKERLTKERYKHSLAVAETAKKLAIKEKYDPQKAYLAGLLHDFAKQLDQEKVQTVALKSDWQIDQDELALPELLHAPAGAFLAKQEFKIDDEDILEAIRFHTIGSPEMGILAQIIYLADFIEPGRDFPGVEKMHNEINKGLTPGIIAITSQIIKFNIDRGHIIHPNTLLLRNAYLRRTK